MFNPPIGIIHQLKMFTFYETNENIFDENELTPERTFKFTPPEEDISDENPLKKKVERAETPTNKSTNVNTVTKQTNIEEKFIISKREVKEQLETKSFLTETLKSRGNSKLVKIITFVPTNKGLQKVKLDLELSITGFELILRSLDECKDSRVFPIDFETQNYILRECNQKGEEVLSTARPFDLKKSIREYNCFLYLLIHNIDPQKKEKIENINESSITNWQTKRFNRYDSTTPSLDDVRIEIFLPNSKVGRLFIFSPDIYVKDLQKLLCTKLGFESDKTFLQIEENGEKKLIPKKIMDKTLHSVDLGKIYIQKTVEEMNSQPVIIEPSEKPVLMIDPVINPINDESTVEYIVTKTNIMGYKQERLLTISPTTIDTKILNPSTSLFGFARSNPKNPVLWIKDIQNIKENVEKRTIDLQFQDEFGQTKNVYYEAKTRIECAEICTKLRERLKIQKMKQENEKRKSMSVSMKKTQL